MTDELPPPALPPRPPRSPLPAAPEYPAPRDGRWPATAPPRPAPPPPLTGATPPPLPRDPEPDPSAPPAGAPAPRTPARARPLLGLAAAFVAGVALTIGAVVALVPERQTRTIVRETPMAAADGLSGAEIYRRAAPGVVYITAAGAGGVSTGTGFVVSADGTVLTNAHVIDGAEAMQVQFADGAVRPARLVGEDPSTDLAALHVDADDLKLHPLTLGDSDDVTPGDPVLAIGNPFGLQSTLTQGVVSAVGRTIPSLTQFAISGAIQTDAAINPGNSGGPLLDAAGKVVGINSQIRTDGSDGNIGIGFAVPINTAADILPELKHTGTVRRAWLGITAETVTPAMRGLDLDARRGALVTQVVAASPAQAAGLRAGDHRAIVDGRPLTYGGDVITSVDGRPVTTAEAVVARVAAARPGDRMRLKVIRDGQPRQLTAHLADRPAGS